MLKVIQKINRSAPRFSGFHYAFHFIENVFLDYHWFVMDNNFYWPEGYLPDFFNDEYEKSIFTNNGRVIDFSNDGMFGVVSPEFMFTFYKNMWDTWQDVIAIRKEDLGNIDKKYVEKLSGMKMEDVDIERHPVLFTNVDAAFWVLRSANEEYENKLIEHYAKIEGIEYDSIPKENW
jgi:hypothetical protein